MRSRIYIEITNRCNLSCDFCPGTRRPPRTMTPAEFRTLTQKLRGETGYLYFHVLGEPLLHPQLPELLIQGYAAHPAEECASEGRCAAQDQCLPPQLRGERRRGKFGGISAAGLGHLPAPVAKGRPVCPAAVE